MSFQPLQFVPDHVEMIRVRRHPFRYYADWRDYVVAYVVWPYTVIVTILMIVVAGYAGSIVPGSHLPVAIILMFGAFYLWRTLIRSWLLAYVSWRSQKIAPMVSVTFTMDESGFHLVDDHSGLWSHWGAVDGAKLVDEGVMIFYQGRGLLLPERAFASTEQRDELIATIGARVAGTA